MAKKRFGYGDYYCGNCGAPLEKGSAVCPHCALPYDVAQRCAAVPVIGAGGIGWSAESNNPCFGRTARKNRIASVIFAFVVCGIIFAVMYFTGNLSAESGGMKIFGILMAVLWTFWIIWMIAKSIPKKDWDGVVEHKEESLEQKVHRDSDGSRDLRSVTKYLTVIRKADGGRKKIVEYDRWIWYGYLHEGETVRFRGNHMEYYEKYDKSKETKLMCASCYAMRDPRENFCGRCGCILLKGQPVTYTPPVQQPQIQPQPAATGKRFCPQCGAPLTAGKRFCGGCGMQIQ